jgi:hypothetical protein
MKNISKADLLALVDEVKKDLKDIAAKEASKLSKADAPPPVEGSASSSSPESSTASASPEGSSSASAGAPPPGAPPPEASAPPPGPEASAAPPPAGPEGSAPPPGPGAEAAPAGPSQEELVSLYAALAQSAPQDFEAHVAAIQQVMQGMGGGQPGPEGSAPPAPEGSAPPMGKSVHEGSSPGPHKERAEGSGSSDPDSSPVDKKEGSASASESSSSSVSKSEADALRADLKKAQETIEQMGKAFEQYLTIPQRKAVTGLTIIPFPAVKKSEGPAKKPFGEMTEAEVKVALKDVVASPKLSKADREYINGYMLNPGQFKVEGLEPIFNKVQ